MKKCNKCGIYKESIGFHKHKNGLLGLDSICKICKKEYQSLKKEEISNYQKKYYLINKDAISLKNRTWHQNNRERDRIRYKKWYEKNKAKKFAWKNNKAKKDMIFKLKETMRSRLYMALKGKVKKSSSISYLGCSVQEFKKYLEGLFQPGMTWENWSLNGWHIDHIKPLASFDLSKEEQIRKACNYKNLQPLWAKQNLIKGSK